MLDSKPLDEFLQVGGQIGANEVVDAAHAGFATIINNRPDAEAPDQPTSAEIEGAARDQGLDYHHIPVVASNITDTDVVAFAAAAQQSKGPVLAFCRTGTRCAILWALSQAGKQSTGSILQSATDAGFDLSKLGHRLDLVAERVAATQQNKGEAGR